MPLFEHVIDQNILTITKQFGFLRERFYLAGGTAIAMQMGHRRSVDLDFFTQSTFEPQEILEQFTPDSVPAIHLNTLHCIFQDVRLSFLYYPVPLIFPLLEYNQIFMADVRDIVAEKYKTIAQRGAKKDFCDLYAALHSILSIEESCHIFRQRFQQTGLNFYSVLKSLTWFTDADEDPEPVWFQTDYSTEWADIKSFFGENSHKFSKNLLD